ncbi:MAG: alpha/beta hydrolase [Anaerolineaceae bacterium]|nr:alpha/beta hydrolase [Anaerolineaceae bacterium]
MKRIRWYWIVLLVLMVAVAGFLVWAANPASPEAAALAALESDSQVQVSYYDQGILFTPLEDQKQTNLIFYPGGRVDYQAYAPTMHKIAAQGYPVYLVRMPLSLAVFAPNRAENIISQASQDSEWVIGGHSLGGAMAANFAYQHPDQISGLLLWASYPTESNSLMGADIKVTSISGSLDGLATVDDINNSVWFLPADTQFVVINGGNHAQFGYYGPQKGDNVAEISREAQQEQILEASLNLLTQIKQ